MTPGAVGPDGGPLVFVSYCHEDAEWLRRFEVMLKPEARGRGLRVWSDRSIATSREWRPEIQQAIERADVALLLVSPDFLASDFIMGEELPALIERGVPLVPVLLRRCRHEGVEELASVQWAHDPGRDGPVAKADDVDGAIVRVTDALMAILDDRDRVAAGSDEVDARPARERAPALVASGREGSMSGVPDAPMGYVARDELDGLRDELLGEGRGGLAITGGRGLGLSGQGGIGKTVLAAALARDPLVRGHFPGGVFWVALGESPDLVGAQIDLLARLGVPAEGVRSTLDGVDALGDALAGRRCLLVVDDVWTAAGAQAFDIATSDGRVLYTTRDPGTLRDVRARVRRIEVLSEAAAKRLLAGLAPGSAGEPRDDIERVLAATGRVALALALVGAAVGRGGRSWPQVADELERAGDTFLRHPYANVFKAMGIAVAALDPEVAAAHETLAVYPQDARIPMAAIARLWAHLYGLTAAQSRERLALLARRELVSMDGETIALHDLQRDFLLLRVESLRLLHHELLGSYRELLPAPASPWRALPRDEPYIWEHLVEHLVGVGDAAGAGAVARDPGWVAIRAFGGGPHAAEADVRRVAAIVPDDEAIGWVLGRLSQWGHLLGGHGRLGDLAATLWARVTDAPPGTDLDALRELLPRRALTPRWGLPEADPALLRVLEGHGDWVWGAAFSPDGDVLATAGGDGSVRLWDVATGMGIRAFHGHVGGVVGVAFSPDGGLVASAGGDGLLRLWDVATGTQARVLAGHAGVVWGLAFSPDGDVLATAGGDGSVRLWDVAAGRQTRILAGHAGGMWGVAFSAGGNVLASAGSDGLVRLWDVAAGTPTRVLRAHVGGAWRVAFSPDGEVLASAGDDGSVRLWDVAAGVQARHLEGHTGVVSGVAFSPDGGVLASAGDDGSVRLWDIAGGTPARIFEGHTGVVWGVAFSPDGAVLASAGADGSARLWDVASGAQPRVLHGRAGGVSDVALSSDGRVLASAGGSGSVLLWDVASGARTRVLEGEAGSACGIAFSSDGAVIAVAAGDRMVRLWDAATGVQARVRGAHRGGVTGVAFSPVGGVIACAGSDGSVRLEDVATRMQARVLNGHEGAVRGVAFSPAGDVLASAGDDTTVRLWDIAASRQLELLEGHDGSVRRVAFSADGRVLASAGNDGSVRLWDVATGLPAAVLEGHAGSVRGVAFGSSPVLLASAGDDGTVRLWDVAGATLVASVRLGEPVTALVVHGCCVAIGLRRAVACLTIVDLGDNARTWVR